MTQQAKTYSSRYEIDVEQIEAFPKMYWANGFDFPDLPVITNEEQDKIQAYSWGMIPYFAKTEWEIDKIRSRNLNARDDKVFELNTWKKPIMTQRCLVVLDAYYEYHTVDKTTKVPYRFTLVDDPVLTLAGLYDSWSDRATGLKRQSVTIVTTSANKILERIHNNPDMLKRGGPRMPLILTKETEKLWLNIDTSDPAGVHQLQELMTPIPSDLLQYHTVPRLLGKEGVGNSEAATERYDWPLIGLP
jgi:putative SOS response-associated peptidase YedK